MILTEHSGVAVRLASIASWLKSLIISRFGKGLPGDYQPVLKVKLRNIKNGSGQSSLTSKVFDTGIIISPFYSLILLTKP